MKSPEMASLNVGLYGTAVKGHLSRLLQRSNFGRKMLAMKASDTVAIDVELPASIPKEEARLMMALKLYEKGRLTLGHAARTAGHSKRAFIDILGTEGLPVLDSDPAELVAEIDW